MTQQFPVWMTITVGAWKRLDVFLAALRGMGHKNCLSSVGFEGDMQFIVGQVAATLAQTEEKVLLSRATGRQLTGKADPTRAEILAAVQDVGDLLIPEAAFTLRVGYGDQPMRGQEEWMYVATEPVTGWDNKPCELVLVSRDPQWCNAGGRAELCIYGCSLSNASGYADRFVVFRSRTQ